MTTTELVQRLLRYTKFDDIGNLPVDDTIDILEAISSGIRDWCMLAPADFTRRTVTATLKKSATLDDCVFKSGSKDFTPSANLSEYIGSTCKIEGESEYNRITENGKLLFESETTGSKKLEYWKDAINLGRTQKVISAPLIRGNRLRMWHDADRDRRTDGNSTLWRDYATGEPKRYWLDTEDSASNSPPRFVLRVWPLPTSDEQISFDVQVTAPRYSPSALTNPEHVPVMDEYCESMLVPLAARELISSPIFNGNASAVMEAGKRAERRAINLVPVSATANAIFTPTGW
tara:strand:- start:5095 stop:5961 length:867 start_codon:yes stop_codon:yes gene_type:complete